MSAALRRAQLLDVAGALFAEHGFHGLSMEQLADAAGVSKPVLYQHFPSKRDLYLALVHAAIAALEAQVGRALDGTRDNRARVEGAIAAYFDYVEHPRFRLLFATAELGDDEVRAVVDAAFSRVSQTIGRLIAEDAGLDEQGASLLASGVRGLATIGAQWWTEHAALDKTSAVQLLAQLAWRGLGSFNARQGPPPEPSK
jgi:AcrR family transcriptional regulator